MTQIEALKRLVEVLKSNDIKAIHSWCAWVAVEDYIELLEEMEGKKDENLPHS